LPMPSNHRTPYCASFFILCCFPRPKTKHPAEHPLCATRNLKGPVPYTYRTHHKWETRHRVIS
jgi:hypothetical protein